MARLTRDRPLKTFAPKNQRQTFSCECLDSEIRSNESDRTFDIIRFFQPRPPTFARFGLETFSEGLFDSEREKIVGVQT